MTRLRLQDGLLLLEGGGDEEIFHWDHRLFFTTLCGYGLDEGRSRYSFSDNAQMLEVLRDTVEYLREESIGFEVDAEIRKLLQQLQDAKRDYDKAYHAGLEIQRSAQVLDVHPQLIRQLKVHQVRAVQHLLTVGNGANFSVPGSGKTTVIYAAFDLLRRQGAVDKLLVIGPRSCFLPWEDEFEACFGFPAASARLTGSKRSRYAFYLESARYDVFLCTYQTAANDVDALIELCKKHATLVVIDESHNIKRLQGGVWSEAMLRIAPYATRRAILSGTPVPNSYADLWSQFTFLWPGKEVLGDRVSYRFRCEETTHRVSIREAIQPFFVRVRKSELGLPPFNLERIGCGLKPYQESIYHALSARFLREIDSSPQDRQVLRQWRKARMVRLIQAASNPTLVTRYSEEFDIPPLSGKGASVIQLIDKYPRYEIPAKVERAVQLVRALLERGEKVVLWTSFVHNIRMLKRLLRDTGPYVVYGAVPRDASEDMEFNREQQLVRFKEVERPAVLLANPAACAESVSLHKACHHAVYLDRTFNCGQYMQSLDRIHRIGLAADEIVTYHIIVANDTIDETIDRRLEEKQANMVRLLEDELPLGTLEVETHQMGRSVDEESVDFEQTMNDIRRQLESRRSKNTL